MSALDPRQIPIQFRALVGYLVAIGLRHLGVTDDAVTAEVTALAFFAVTALSDWAFARSSKS